MTLKSCFRCKSDKPLVEFNKNPSTKDGLQRYCAECYKAAKREYYERNKERLLAKCAEYYEQNKDKHKAMTADYYNRNADKIAQRASAWRKANKPIQASHRAKRRARIANAGGNHTAADIERLLIIQKHRCACCGGSVRKRFHLDHIEPLSRGGSNGRENLQILCAACNLSKSAKDPLDFMRSRGFLL